MQWIYAFWLLTLAASSLWAQEPVKGFQDGEYEGLPYRLRIFEGNLNGAYSVVLYLHGAGERGNDNQKQISESCDVLDSLTAYLDSAQIRCLVVVPQCAATHKWVNVDWTLGSYISGAMPMSSDLQAAYDLLNELDNRFDVDGRSLYLLGASMGGYGVWDLLQRSPGKFAGAVAICGAADTTRSRQIALTPVWAFHGTLDAVIPVSGSREIVAKLVEEHAGVCYTEYRESGHLIWPKVAKEKSLFDWLFSHHRSDAVNAVQSERSRRVILLPERLAIRIMGVHGTERLLISDALGRKIFDESVSHDGDLPIYTALQGVPEYLYTVIGTRGEISRGKVELSYK